MPMITNREPVRKPILPAIELDDVRLTLASTAGPVDILNGVSLKVQQGEAVALLGPSGSGKSSLLMVTAGLETATSGSVAVAGQRLTGLSEDALARFRRQHVGIMSASAAPRQAGFLGEAWWLAMRQSCPLRTSVQLIR